MVTGITSFNAPMRFASEGKRRKKQGKAPSAEEILAATRAKKPENTDSTLPHPGKPLSVADILAAARAKSTEQKSEDTYTPSQSSTTPTAQRPAPPKGSGGQNIANPTAKAIEALSQDIIEKRNRKTYKKLQTDHSFYYGGQQLNALNILEILYNRDTQSAHREKRLTQHYFTQLDQEDGYNQIQFRDALNALVNANLLESSEDTYVSNNDYDYHRKSGEYPYNRYWKYKITNIGKGVVELYHKDVAATKSTQTLALDEQPSDTHRKQLLKTLIEPNEWGVTGLTILKALNTFPERKLTLWQNLCNWLFGTQQSAGRWASAEALQSAVSDVSTSPNTTTAKSKTVAPLEKLTQIGLIALYNKEYTLTDKGQLVVDQDNLWNTGLITTDDLKALAHERVETYRNALKELTQLLRQFETVYEKTKADYEQSKTEIDLLQDEARTLYMASKNDTLAAAEQQELIQAALNKKKTAKERQAALEEDKKMMLDHTIYQLHMAQTLQEPVEANLKKLIKQALQDEVKLSIAVLKNDLSKFVTRWTQEAATMEDPVQKYIGDLQDKLESQSSELGMDPKMLDIQRRVEARIQKRREASLQDELEAEIEALEQEAAQVSTESTAEASSETPVAEEPKSMSQENKK